VHDPSEVHVEQASNLVERGLLEGASHPNSGVGNHGIQGPPGGGQHGGHCGLHGSPVGDVHPDRFDGSAEAD
jgi:hypothetical protein